MARAKITAEEIHRLKPDGTWLWDTEVIGLGIRRQRHEAIYTLKTRLDGKPRWFSIGPHGNPWTPETAREDAKRLLSLIHVGFDPANAQRCKGKELLISDMLALYIDEYVSESNAPSTAAEIRRLIQKEINPSLGSMPITRLEATHISDWHSTYEDRPYIGNRALAYLRKALNIAVIDWDICPTNPALVVTMFSETKRHRQISKAERDKIDSALGILSTEGHPGAHRALRLILLTGMTIGQICRLKWSYFDSTKQCIQWPTRKQSSIATTSLSHEATSYLNSLKPIGPYVCYGAIPNHAITKWGIYDLWYLVLAESGISNARIHDLRRRTLT